MNTIKSQCAVLSVGLVCLLAPLTLPAATYFIATNGVDTNPGSEAWPFKTIQHGINSAAEADTVQVTAGTYFEHVVWTNKSLTLQGAGPGLSIIDGGLNGVCLYLESITQVHTGIVTGLTFQNGWNPQLSGGIENYFIAGLTVSNCAFVGNMGQGGGAMFNQQGSPTVAHCLFTGNKAYVGAAIYNGASSATVSDCVFDRNQGSSSGAIYNQGGNPLVIRCTFSSNSGGAGGAIYNLNSSPTVSGCLFIGNTTGDIHSPNKSIGGAMYNEGQTITNCRPLLVNCIFISNNVTGRGGAIYSKVASPVMMNCTFTGNGHIAVVNDNSSAATIANCVFWGNTNPTNGPTAILDDNNPSVTTYSDVQGGWPGTGNLNADPLFVNTAAGNLRLLPGSPCINAAAASAMNLPASDFDGAPRVVGGAPDMGAFETTPGLWFVDRALGNDANAGNVTAPFQTVTRAFNAAANGHSIYIKQGNYGGDHPRFTKTLRLFNWGDAGLARLGQP
jgi:predicted outer membrane repeat protein